MDPSSKPFAESVASQIIAKQGRLGNQTQSQDAANQTAQTGPAMPPPSGEPRQMAGPRAEEYPNVGAQ